MLKMQRLQGSCNLTRTYPLFDVLCMVVPSLRIREVSYSQVIRDPFIRLGQQEHQQNGSETLTVTQRRENPLQANHNPELAYEICICPLGTCHQLILCRWQSVKALVAIACLL